MSSKRSTTVRLDPEDAAALARARADGLSSSELIRRGLRLVAAKYYRGRRRPPTTALFVSTDPKLGDEDQLFARTKR
jgi:Arc/MetJ-type ribon-helix-helix transcriptional regulator